MANPYLILAIGLIILINYLLEHRWRSLFLLTASLGLLGFFSVESLIALVCFAVLNYLLATVVRYGWFLLISGILINITVVVLFNYFVMTGHGIRFEWSTIQFSVSGFVVSLGLSYYSLQNITYLLEVFYRKVHIEKNLFHFLFYHAFFPRLIAGPVMTTGEFMPQIPNAAVTTTKLISGFNQTLFGVVKKMVIADALAPSVHSVFDFQDPQAGITVLLGCMLFTLQLYFDFSGYTDMALGIARMLGYEMKENFRMPFRAGSVTEFWRRWHISLIHWFTTTIYYPLVYKLRAYKKLATLVGVLVTFVVSGIWHGIGYTFLAWALLHVLYLWVEVFTKNLRFHWWGKRRSFPVKLLGSLTVFVLVSFSNLFFRATSWENAKELCRSLFNAGNFIPADLRRDLLAELAVGGHQLDLFNFYSTLCIAAAVLIFEHKLNVLSKSKQWHVLYTVILAMVLFVFGVYASAEHFIYMQF